MKVVTTKSTLKTEVVASEDGMYRYLLKKDWSSKGKEKIITIIMIQPSSSDIIELDMTTLYVINNVNEQGYNVVNIVNIFSSVTEEYMTDKVNDEYILKAVNEGEKVVWGVGNAGKYNKIIQARVNEVVKLIDKHRVKVYVLTDSKSDVPRHPLSANVRLEWNLKSNINLN